MSLVQPKVRHVKTRVVRVTRLMRSDFATETNDAPIPKPKGIPGKGARNGRNGYNIYDAMELEKGNIGLKMKYNELAVCLFI